MTRYPEDQELDDNLSTALRFLTQGPSETTLAELSDAERKELRRRLRQIRYWHRAGEITGFGIGLKQVQGRFTEQPACCIYVRRKRPRSRLRKLERIPETLTLPGLAATVHLDVEELSPLEQVALGREQRPVFPGLSAGHCASGVTGTIGAEVRRSDRPGERFLLGASHVFALSGCARRGDAIVQPGGLHGGSCPRHTIGRLDDHVKPRAGQSFPNLADLALVQLKPEITTAPGEIATRRLGSRQQVRPRDVLFRIGCQTGLEAVVVEHVSFATWMPHTVCAGGRQLFGFRDLLLYRGFSVDGDSGGPVLTRDGTLIGIHVGQAGNRGVAIPVWSLPLEWNVTL